MKKSAKIALAVVAAVLVVGVALYFALTWLLTENRRNQPPDDGSTTVTTTDATAQSTTPAQGGVLVYTKTYELQGDPGDGLSDTAAAQALYEAIRSDFPGDDVHLTLFELGDTPTGEAYLFAGPIDTTYAVVYGNGDLYYQSGRDGSWVAMNSDGTDMPMTAERAEAILNEAVFALKQRMSANGKIALVPTREETVNGEHAFLFALGADTPEKFTAEYHFAVTESGQVLVMDIMNGTEYVEYTDEAA